MSLIPQFFYLRLSIVEIIVLFLLGMLFEVITGEAWIYNPQLLKSTFKVWSKGVSWINGLGWIGTLILGLSLGKALRGFGLNSFVADVLGIGIVGNIIEDIFLRLGLWEYNKKHWIITLWTQRPIMVGQVPLAVRLGYFLIMGTVMPLTITPF